jgi:hypothetical protein
VEDDGGAFATVGSPNGTVGRQIVSLSPDVRGRDPMTSNDKPRGAASLGIWANIGVWIALGAAFGVLAGILFGNVGLGIALGAALGMTVGVLVIARANIRGE